jgi:DNA ligase 1
LSEKLDGMRAFWNGKKLISKQGNEIECPSWFIEDLPSNIKLDGELWIGRGKYENTIELMMDEMNEKQWKSTRFIIFDIPSSMNSYETRIEELNGMKFPSHIEVISQWKCKGNEDLMNILNSITENGGEGIMAIESQSIYSSGERTNQLLKVKSQDDNEVQVIEILPTGLYCLQ